MPVLKASVLNTLMYSSDEINTISVIYVHITVSKIKACLLSLFSKLCMLFSYFFSLRTGTKENNPDSGIRYVINTTAVGVNAL